MAYEKGELGCCTSRWCSGNLIRRDPWSQSCQKGSADNDGLHGEWIRIWIGRRKGESQCRDRLY